MRRILAALEGCGQRSLIGVRLAAGPENEA
jgi:hypothetical protein